MVCTPWSQHLFTIKRQQSTQFHQTKREKNEQVIMSHLSRNDLKKLIKLLMDQFCKWSRLSWTEYTVVPTDKSQFSSFFGVFYR